MNFFPKRFSSESLRGNSAAPTLARSQAARRSWPFLLDLLVACVGLAAFYGVVQIGRLWLGQPQPNVVLSLSPRALPRYALYSVVRMGLAYVLSLVFAIGYGYVAAYSRRLEPLLIAALDILQSIPVLSFLPGVMLAMTAVFHAHQLGLELGAIVLIFTGQVWNMAFSFYSSLKSLPRELTEASTVYHFSRAQRLLQLELPYAAIGLIWNSMVSVAGGWFFLMACEMFVLGSRDFRLPGLGSYLQTAASEGRTGAILWGLAVMIAIIVATDQLVWRPIIAWSDRFKFEQVESEQRIHSPLLHILRQSSAARVLDRMSLAPLTERLYRHEALRTAARQQVRQTSPANRLSTGLRIVAAGAAVVVVGYAALQAMHLLRGVDTAQVGTVLRGAGATLLRVVVALTLATAWTVPAGVAIGSNPKLARVAQPLAQIAASVPATALFPVLLLLLLKSGAGMGTAAILLMLLGTQWYVLFNVLAGAMAIPGDLKEVAKLFRFGTVQRWRTIILPGIFPFLLTGLITASGGAWNASIIAEYFHLRGQTMQAFGLGEQISAATDSGHFAVLLLATIVMALMVVTINRLVWRPLFRLAESKYKLA